MRAVVLGSTGFLGRTIVAELARRGHAVVGYSREGAPCPEAPAAAYDSLDVVEASDTDLDACLAGADAVVYCLGPDERVRIPRPATTFFQRLLVAPAERVAYAVRRCGVARFVVLGSYFTAFDRLHPEWQLSARHPYIKARADQQRRVHADAGAASTSMLEIPFVFGSLPGIVPMWKSYLIDPARRFPVVFSPAGRNAAATNLDVAQAISGLVEGWIPAGDHPVVTDNYTFERLNRVIVEALDRPRRPVVTIPTGLLAAGLRGEQARRRLTGAGAGLTTSRLARDILARDLGLDPAAYAPVLGLTPRSLDDAVRATVAASLA